MKHTITTITAVLFSLCLVASLTYAQDPWPGVTVVSRLNSSSTLLVDINGNTIQTWQGSSTPGQMAYLFEDYSLLRTNQAYNSTFHGGGAGGHLQLIDDNNNVTWQYTYSTSSYIQHHDIHPMPNGNILMVCWELKSQSEAQAMGRQNIYGSIWPTKIVELQPSGSSGGTIVWEWHMWDHMIQDADSSKPNYGVIADHPELMDINAGSVQSGDWEHINAIDYNETLDQIVFSSHNLNEFYVIDHSTTTAEAASHTGGNCGKGGDLLYRWGNPQIYDRGNSSSQKMYVCHGVNWIDDNCPGAGNIIILNNGDEGGPGGGSSEVLEITPPLLPDGNYDINANDPYGPDNPTWSYSDSSFYSAHLGGCYRLPNGNTLITEGTSGYVFEVTEDGSMVWDYDVSGELASVMRYNFDSTPTPTPTPFPFPTFTPTATPTNTPTVTPTNTPVVTSTPGECLNTGDVTQDGGITAGDAQLAFYIVLGSYSPSQIEDCAADCNGDSLVTAGDAQQIFLTALGSDNCVDPL